MGIKKVKKADGTTAVVQTGKGGKGIVGNLGSDKARSGPKTVDLPTTPQNSTSPQKHSSIEQAYAKYQRTYHPTQASVLSEAENLKGSPLTIAEKTTASVLGKWYEEGSLEVNVPLGGHEEPKHVNFPESKIYERNGKTVGYVEIGIEGFGYFYEVDGDEVSFRQADGYFHRVDKKLPFNYGLRKKLDGKAISEKNLEWKAQSMINRFGG